MHSIHTINSTNNHSQSLSTPHAPYRPPIKPQYIRTDKTLQIVQWNCHSATTERIAALELFLHDFQPDIVCLNETKLNQEQANQRLSINNYTTHHRARNTDGRGGGVAILVRNQLNCQLISLQLHKDTEAVAVAVTRSSSEKPLIVATLYNPPSNVEMKSSFELFTKLNELGNEFLVIGDLNAKLGRLGHPTNDAGTLLDDLCCQLNLTVLNDNSPTYFQYSSTREYAELLDIAVCSASLSSKLRHFTVHSERRMGSDHAPIQLVISDKPDKVAASNAFDAANSFNFKKANWLLFAASLPSNAPPSVMADLEQLNEFVCEHILKAARMSIPPRKNGPRCKSFPRHIVKLIIDRKAARLLKDKGVAAKQEYNRLTNELQEQICAHRSDQWDSFISKLGPRPSTTRPFWKKINQIRNGSNNQSKGAKLKRPDGSHTANDEEKAATFASTLESTFRGSTAEFDEAHRRNVEDELTQALSRMSASVFDPVTTVELKKHIARLPMNSAAGASGIHNMLLRKLPDHFIWLVVHLINLSLASSRLPSAWKHAIIIMLPKTKVNLHDPTNYRPISLLCCLGKLCERVVQGRLYGHLEAGGWLTPQQSGFRRFRRATDNILFLTQKVQENLNKRKKVCCFFFDIKKAFDNVWHAGLLWKLVCSDVPAYLLLWTAAFLADRVFQVRVNSALSHRGQISAGVPQGAVLSPTLFNVFINDIPLEGTPSLSYSTLYADDLATYFTYTTDDTPALRMRITRHIKRLEEWLARNRLEMNVSKTCYTVFTRSPKAKKNYDFRMNGLPIHHDPQPKFLGIIMDERANFDAQVEHIRSKCSTRLNVIRIIAHKSWKLSTRALTNTYKALIGSVLDYSALIAPCLSEVHMKSLQAIQNKALRVIHKRPFDSHSDELCQLSGCPLVSSRLSQLAHIHVAAAQHFNPLISSLIRDYRSQISSIRRNKAPPTILCNILSIHTNNNRIMIS